jgi:hypothetical protein
MRAHPTVYHRDLCALPSDLYIKWD